MTTKRFFIGRDGFIELSIKGVDIAEEPMRLILIRIDCDYAAKLFSYLRARSMRTMSELSRKRSKTISLPSGVMSNALIRP